ncbi:MAG: FAD-binding oxidoreductase [SAR324 cluster bacterium]|nr:FAD-binding oxidoreductase [SAR324 cluster bacterium]
MSGQHRKFWGWGVTEGDLSAADKEKLRKETAARFGLGELTLDPPPKIEELNLRAPRVKPPDALAEICTTDPEERAGHTLGKGIRDIIRALQREFRHPPDFVAFPRSEAEVTSLLDWCSERNVAAIPYGGGSSVVGGIEPNVGEGFAGVISLDLKNLGKVLEIDQTSRAAHIQAGIYGPALEEQLRPHGLTLRHFPQSFEFSTLGGWIATRSGGHYATLYTHIDDFVESLRVVTPKGLMESRRLPGDGAGPAPERLFIGSEGTLGVITSAWMRLQHRPKFRANTSVFFDDFLSAAEAVRALSQAGLYPANCRILDPNQALMSEAGDGSKAVLVLGFESADHPLEAWMARALECCSDHGGSYAEDSTGTSEDGAVTRKGAAGAWRQNFLVFPYIREVLVSMGIIAATFETAITWDRFPTFHAAVMEETQKVLERVCGKGIVGCRFTHAYPDGAAPYYSVAAPGKKGDLLRQWDEIKAVVSETIIRLGGTITHHHAVGRDHRPWYDRQRPELFAAAFGAAKKALDPAGVLNPGVLIDPNGR